MTDEIVCKRCGKCCKDCAYLIRHGSKLTSCRIYGDRLGTIIRGNKVCVERKCLKENFEGCPYNE